MRTLNSYFNLNRVTLDAYLLNISIKNSKFNPFVVINTESRSRVWFSMVKALNYLAISFNHFN